MPDKAFVTQLGTAIPGVRRDPGRFVVTVDASKCVGHGTCVELAAGAFALDRFGYAYVLPDLTARAAADPALRAALRDAEVRCPERAIRVELVRDTPSAVPSGPVDAGQRPPASRAMSVGTARLMAPDGGTESLAQWQARGGFSTPRSADFAEVVGASGVVGQGGAAFPVASKWRAARGVLAPVVVANGAEREPGTGKDRYLMEHRPFLVLDGLAATMSALGAGEGVVAIDESNRRAFERMRAAVVEAQRSGLLSEGVRVVPVPARYVAGEETALLRSLIGEEPLPHAKPPFPASRGLLGRPTIVHNMETLAQLALIAAHGAAWFREAGTAQEPGTGLFSLGRFGEPPAVIERPLGTTLRDLLEEEGWSSARAALVGGWSGGLLPASLFDLELTNGALLGAGASLGTKSVQVLTEDDCPVRVAASILEYFAGQSAGQCPPCTQGLPYLAELISSLAEGAASPGDLDEGRGFAESLVDRGACRLPDGAVRMLASLFRHFGSEVDLHLAGGCTATPLTANQSHAPLR